MAAVRMTPTEILGSIALLTLEQQRQLNHDLVAQIKHGRRVQSQQAAGNFHIGQIVTFSAGPRRGMKIIKIESIGPVKAHGAECDRQGNPIGFGGRWGVPMNMLRAVV